ncbi:MAG: PSD1 and planctomycete cytochrome C domain-containing protein, partial [Planctomycetota bacterium]
MGRRLRAGTAGLALVGAWATAGANAEGPSVEGAEPTVRYGRDIRPLLSDRCFACHGTDPATRRAGLRLDVREEALGGFIPAIVPGDLDESELWRRIHSDDPFEAMPPPEAKKRPLTAEERALIGEWIRSGAEYEPHWAFVAPERPPLPAVGSAEWVRDPIDAFVLATLEAQGVEPAPAADRATWLRRVFLDLTGLTPTPEELDAFLGDTREDAPKQWVDRLFDEEPYRSRVAEWLTTDWMDVARYADTSGIHTDNGRQMWLWRDWVLEAFRSQMPFDRFIELQMAGDLLDGGGLEGRIASGFHRNHVTTDEGGAIAEEYLLEYAIDRVNTTSAAFLGLTVGCARCHDHKYDPTTQEDFYSLVGFFNSVDEPGLYSQTNDPARAYEPFLEVPTEAQSAELARIDGRIGELERSLDAPLPREAEDYATFLAEARASGPVAWRTPDVLTARSSDPRVTLEPRPDGTVVAGGALPDVEDYTLTLTGGDRDERLLLIEALATPPADPDSPHPPGAGRADHGNVVLTQVQLETRAGGDAAWERVALQWAWADHTQRNQDYEVGHALAPGTNGWAAAGNHAAGARTLLLLAERGFRGAELRLTLSFRSPYAAHSLAHFRVRTSPLERTERLPVQFGRWYRVGPFGARGAEARQTAYTTAHGPESATTLDLTASFGAEDQVWTFDGALRDDAPVTLPGEVLGATYVGRTVWSPDAREVSAFVASDDGFAVFVNGEQVAAREVDRGVGEEDPVRLPLRPGANALVLKIVNTGGPTGYAFRWLEDEQVLEGELPSALVPDDALPAEQAPQLQTAWRRRFFAAWRAMDDELAAVRAERAALRQDVPRTMVMRELHTPRPSYVMGRGQYDHPDTSKALERRPPAFLPPLPEGAPRDRAGLAQWLTAAENPLTARVLVNRYWQLLFGHGLVRSSGDFGLQGNWPSHPELLDWLAVEFRDSGWDLQGLLKRIVLSSTYAQSSRVRPELAERDPDNRWLARYPRRRLTAEQIRDHALHVSGLLIERLGGPSVKPYQPEGLWQEVAMLSSNTRFFERGRGE